MTDEEINEEREQRLSRMNWTAVSERFRALDGENSEIKSLILAQEHKLTALVSQLRELTDEVMRIKAGRFGTGPSAGRG